MTTFTKVTVRLTVWTMSFFCEKLLPLPWLYLAQDYRVLKKTWQKNPGWHKVQVCAAGNDDFYDSSGTWCFSFGQFLRRQVRRDCGELCMPGILRSLSCALPLYLSLPHSHHCHLSLTVSARHPFCWWKGSITDTGVCECILMMYIQTHLYVHTCIHVWSHITYIYVCIRTSCLICRNYITAKSFNQLGSHLDEYQNIQFE